MGIISNLIVISYTISGLDFHRSFPRRCMVMINKRHTCIRHTAHEADIFGMDDILMEEDIVTASSRFESLASFLPGVDLNILKSAVRRFPVMITMDSERLRYSIEKINTSLPFINPFYLLNLKSGGVELILSCASETFDLPARIEKLRLLIGGKYDFQSFVKHVPHAIIPRYQLVLENHLVVLQDDYGFSYNNSLKVIERWPDILHINLDTSLSALQNSLLKCGIKADKRLIGRMILINPSVLKCDVVKRFTTLKTALPGVDLCNLVSYSPGILMRNVTNLQSRFQNLLAEFSSDANVANLVSMEPNILKRSSECIRSDISAIRAELPDCSVTDLLTRAPALLLGGSGATESFVHINEVVRRVRQLKRVFLYPGGETGPSDTAARLTKHDERTSQPLPLSSLWAPVPEPETRGQGDAPDLDVTRLVLEHSLLLIQSFPMLKRKTRAWVEAFGSSLAYTLLMTVPRAVLKPPSLYSPTVKLFYRWIGSLPMSKEATLPLMALSQPDIASSVPGSAVQATLRRMLTANPVVLQYQVPELEANCKYLSNMLGVVEQTAVRMVITAPRLLSEKRERLQLNAALLRSLLFHSDLLRLPSPSDRSDQSGQLRLLELLELRPGVLVEPLSFAARIEFSKTLLLDGLDARASSLHVVKVSNILKGNTTDFLSYLSGQLRTATANGSDCTQLSFLYARFLSACESSLMSEDVYRSSTIEISENTSAEAERRLCGVINSLCKSAIVTVKNSNIEMSCDSEWVAALSDKLVKAFQESSAKTPSL